MHCRRFTCVRQVIGIGRNEELCWQVVEDLKEEFPHAAISYKVRQLTLSACAHVFLSGQLQLTSLLLPIP